MSFRRHRPSVFAAILSAAIFVVLASTAAQSQSQSAATAKPAPPWAYPVGPEVAPPKPDDTQKHLPNTNVVFTVNQTRDGFNVPDWHPDQHPPLPEVVAHGRKPGVRGCGYCHLPNVQGRPENCNIAGLPAGYIVQQVADFKSGARKSSEPKMGPPANMAVVARNANDDETKAAAQYFSSLKFKPWIRVVESNTVPKTHVRES